MKKCKSCNGTGIVFMKSNSILTGKTKSFAGLKLPEIKSGTEKVTCFSCFGKGLK